MNLPWLTFVIFAPWLGALALALSPGLSRPAVRRIGLVCSLSTLGLAFVLLSRFDPSTTSYQFVEKHAWVASLGIHYHLGLDGMSLVLVLLTGLLTPVALLASVGIERDVRLFNSLFLLVQGGALGVFLALDFFHWFLFWELSLVPAFFLVRLGGGSKASAAAYQFFVYTMAGSAFLLLGFVAVYAAAGTLDFTQLHQLARDGALAAKLGDGGWIAFGGVLLGLAVKVPLFPFHTWLPATYAEAPTGVSMFLTGVMSKMGVYGFLRLLWPLFPDEFHAFAGVLLWLALAGVVAGAFAAIAQRDIKGMLAYSSINHVNYCLLAVAAIGAPEGRPGVTSEAATAALSGAILQIFNHGISAAALFFCAGVLEARSGGRRGLFDFGGLRARAPVFAGLCGIALFSSLGLPGLNGFVGEFLIFRGVFGLAPVAAAWACFGLLATALFLLTFFQRVFHGPLTAATENFAELSPREVAVLLPLVLAMVALGVFPQLLTGLFNALVTSWGNHLTLP